MAKDPKIKTKNLVIMPMSEQEMEAYTPVPADMKISLADPVIRPFYVLWKICLKKTDIMVGTFTFNGTQQKGRVSFNITIDKEYENKGYGTETVKAMTLWAFSQQDVYTVCAETLRENLVMQKVLAKSEFEPVGMGEEGPLYERKKADTNWMAVYMLLGLSIGSSFGLSMGNTGNNGIAMGIGVCIGMAIGAALNKQYKARRAEVEGTAPKDDDNNE